MPAYFVKVGSMADWNPNLYLTFEKERTQPSIDLVSRIDKETPERIIDIGCGPGNSTRVLKRRWPNAQIVGLDHSQAMLEQAKKTDENIHWICKNASENLAELGKFDVVFSNAAIQWIPNQVLLLQNLFGLLCDNGTLAVQVPCTKNMPIHTELQKLIHTEKWESAFQSVSSNYSIHTADFYYDILSGISNSIDLWETNYYHIMNDHAEIVRWYSGSGLRPYLDCFAEESEKNQFLAEYESLLKHAYPLQKDNKVLFPFHRIFFTVNKKEC